MKNSVVNEDYAMLEEAGCKNIGYFCFINNYGYTFRHNGVLYSIEHVTNIYGSYVDFWEVRIDGKYYPEQFRSLKAICGALKGGII